MRGHRVPRPIGTDLVGRVVTDSENKIELGCIGPRVLSACRLVGVAFGLTGPVTKPFELFAVLSFWPTFVTVDFSYACLAICAQQANFVRMKPLKQVGALCVCVTDDQKPVILLVTSRDTGRWVIPKGWPTKRLKAHEAAAREALEEAGVSGKIGKKPIGSYEYLRPHQNGNQLHTVSVYLLAVRSSLDHWPEEGQRERAWFSISTAVRRVAEPELRSLIRQVGKMENHQKWSSVSGLLKGRRRKT